MRAPLTHTELPINPNGPRQNPPRNGLAPHGKTKLRAPKGPGHIKTVALGITPDLIHQGVVDLKGYRVSGAEDVGKLAHVYRDPQCETIRI